MLLHPHPIKTECKNPRTQQWIEKQCLAKIISLFGVRDKAEKNLQEVVVPLVKPWVSGHDILGVVAEGSGRGLMKIDAAVRTREA
jgi:hypothetical protein